MLYSFQLLVGSSKVIRTFYTKTKYLMKMIFCEFNNSKYPKFHNTRNCLQRYMNEAAGM